MMNLLIFLLILSLIPTPEPTAEEIMNELCRSTQTERIEEDVIYFDDAQRLMKIAMAEAESEGVEGKALVMAVIMNRVKDERFPDTIEAVITEEGQFSPVADGRYYAAVPDVECHLALAEIEKGTYQEINALYFENSEGAWQKKHCEYLFTYKNHRFYK